MRRASVQKPSRLGPPFLARRQRMGGVGLEQQAVPLDAADAVAVLLHNRNHRTAVEMARTHPHFKRVVGRGKRIERLTGDEGSRFIAESKLRVAVAGASNDAHRFAQRVQGVLRADFVPYDQRRVVLEPPVGHRPGRNYQIVVGRGNGQQIGRHEVAEFEGHHVRFRGMHFELRMSVGSQSPGHARRHGKGSGRSSVGHQLDTSFECVNHDFVAKRVDANQASGGHERGGHGKLDLCLKFVGIVQQGFAILHLGNTERAERQDGRARHTKI